MTYKAVRVFPHKDPIDVGSFLGLGESLEISAARIKELLTPYLTEERRERIRAVVSERTYTVVPVMEGIHDLGNVAAVLRSAEGLGFQEAHIIDTQPKHKTSRRITQGADKWLDVHRWDQPGRCISALKDRGYAICVTHLEAAVPIEEIDFTQPTAVVFGNELDGVTEEMVESADMRCIIPIRGFVQSYNISVAAALALYEARRQRVDALGGQGDLSPEEREILEAYDYIRAVSSAKQLLPEVWRREQEQ